eukprot:TRINITY_DN11238_c0_g1_i2.p1 TRINITY_DN11238_c0_g1~~TRINITY_DN11238_c0_g1_i2.p1  ORF type:complete len:340 (+),score=100.96 TRINITY_DN11238_c0_g1_i2:114-1133(+)
MQPNVRAAACVVLVLFVAGFAWRRSSSCQAALRTFQSVGSSGDAASREIAPSTGAANGCSVQEEVYIGLVADALCFKLYLDHETSQWPQYAVSMGGVESVANVMTLTAAVVRAGVPGDFVECGVWRGANPIAFAKMLQFLGVKPTERRVYSVDSYQGLPPPDKQYAADAGLKTDFRELMVSEESVRANVRRFGVADWVLTEKGYFNESVPAVARKIDKLAVLRVDGDLYGSTIEVLTGLYPKLQPGGYLIHDDFGIPQSRMALEDYRRCAGITAPIRFVNNSCPADDCVKQTLGKSRCALCKVYWQKQEGENAVEGLQCAQSLLPRKEKFTRARIKIRR